MPSPDSKGSRGCTARVALGLAAGLLAAVSVSAEVYKWVDEQGRVHYGDARPVDRSAETVRTPAPPAGADLLRANSRLDALREREQEAQKARAVEGQEAQRAAQDAARRGARCRAAREQLHVLGLERPLYRLNEQGERVYLDDAHRAAERADAQKRVEVLCR